MTNSFIKGGDAHLKPMDVKNIRIGRFCAGTFAIYWILAVAFYFLSGDQLRLRRSIGEISITPTEASLGELVQGAVAEQSFTAEIERIESIGIPWATFYDRPNAGAVTVELWDRRSGTLVLSESFDVASINDGDFTTVVPKVPIEGLYGAPLMLRLYADSLAGSAVSPFINQSVPTPEGSSLTFAGIPITGALCFIMTGQDYIWTGLHYWKIVALIGTVLGLALLMTYSRCKVGRHSYIADALCAVSKYRFLIRQLVRRDFRTKYKRSILGIFWSFLNPLLTMLIMYFVFSNIFKSDIPNFAAYLLIGTICFNFFSEAVGLTLTSITGNATLITKVYVPKYIYPLTRVMSSVINLAIALVPLIIVCTFTGVRFYPSDFLALYFLVCLIIFSLGLGLFLSTSMVFFRDTQFLWGVFSMIWMYATPIFYPDSIIPDNLRFILQINPLFYFIKGMRICVLDGLSPEPRFYALCFAISFSTLMIGALIFKKCQDRFVLYL